MFHVILVVTIASWVGGVNLNDGFFAAWNYKLLFPIAESRSMFVLLCCLDNLELEVFHQSFRLRSESDSDAGKRLPQRKWTVEYLEKVCVQENTTVGGGFNYFFIFTPIWGNNPIWLIFFNWVETTNQNSIWWQVNNIQSSNISFSSTFKKRNNLEIDWMIFRKNKSTLCIFLFQQGWLSWERTYPCPRYVWRWCSFFRIC